MQENLRAWKAESRLAVWVSSDGVWEGWAGLCSGIHLEGGWLCGFWILPSEWAEAALSVCRSRTGWDQPCGKMPGLQAQDWPLPSKPEVSRRSRQACKTGVYVVSCHREINRAVQNRL